MRRLTAKKAFANFFDKKFANFCPNFAYETNEVSWYANVLLSRVTRFARDNKLDRGQLGTGNVETGASLNLARKF